MMGPRITDYDAWQYCETCANITVTEDWDFDIRMCKACASVMDDRNHILSMLRTFVSEDGLTDSDGNTIFPAVGETSGIYRAIEIIEGEEQ